jgi:DNA-binding GntR family transcriptional regulator
MQRIVDGLYPVGTSLPREIDLASEFGVSRNTVREAMRLLTLDSVITRRKRAGTIVCRADLNAPRVLNYDPTASVAGLGKTTRFILHSTGRRRVPAALVPEAVGEGFSDWLYFSGIRQSLAIPQPICVTDFYLHSRLTAVTHLVGQETGLIWRMIERACGERMRFVRNNILPCRVTKAHAALIDVPPGTLGIQVIRRIYNDRNELLEVVNTICPATRVSFEIAYDLPATG